MGKQPVICVDSAEGGEGAVTALDIQLLIEQGFQRQAGDFLLRNRRGGRRQQKIAGRGGLGGICLQRLQVIGSNGFVRVRQVPLPLLLRKLSKRQMQNNA